MGIVFAICVAVMILLGYGLKEENKGLAIDVSMFKVHQTFGIGATIVLSIIAFLYYYFW
jgi:SSS family solute:Na+ symporter